MQHELKPYLGRVDHPSFFRMSARESTGEGTQQKTIVTARFVERRDPCRPEMHEMLDHRLAVMPSPNP